MLHIYIYIYIYDISRLRVNDPVLLTQYFSAIKARRMRWVENVAHMGERRRAYRISVGKPEGKRLLGIPWRRWEDNINPYPANVEYKVSS